VTDPLDLLALAERLANEAAALLREGLGHTHEIETKSSLTDLVTEYDRAAERLIVEGILAARPGDGLLGEEGTAEPGTSGVRWVIDPLDGTTNFFYGYPAFAVSIAAEIDGEVVAGVVADVSRAETFTAARGHGAHASGHPLHCTDAAELATALVATGFAYDAARRARQGMVVAGLLPRVRDVRRSGSAALDLCAVAAGRVDGYYERGLAPWDLAAGALIAAEAGAAVGDLDGARPSGAFVLATAPALFDPLGALLMSLGASMA
jgi:myo-inositol-1(or 4)-monophosphatase